MSRFKVETENIVQNSGNMLYYSKKMNQIGSAVNSVSNSLSLNSDNIAYLKSSIRDISSSIIENAGKMEVLSNALNEIAKEYNNTEKKVCDCSTQNKTAVSHTGAAFEVPNGTFVAGDPDATKKGLTDIYEKYKAASSFKDRMNALSDLINNIDLLSEGKTVPNSGNPLFDIMKAYILNIADGIVYNKSSDQFTADFFADVFYCLISIGPLAPAVTLAQGTDFNHDGRTLSEETSDYILHEILEKEHVRTIVNVNKPISPEDVERSKAEMERIFKDDWNKRIKYNSEFSSSIKPFGVPDVPFLSPAQ